MEEYGDVLHGSAELLSNERMVERRRHKETESRRQELANFSMGAAPIPVASKSVPVSPKASGVGSIFKKDKKKSVPEIEDCAMLAPIKEDYRKRHGK